MAPVTINLHAGPLWTVSDRRISGFPALKPIGKDVPGAECISSTRDFRADEQGRRSHSSDGSLYAEASGLNQKLANRSSQDKIMNTNGTSPERAPLPPFTHEPATEKVRLAEMAGNSRDPEKIALGLYVDSSWRSRAEFVRATPRCADQTGDSGRAIMEQVGNDGSSRSFGLLGETESPCDSPTSGMTTPATGFASSNGNENWE